MEKLKSKSHAFEMHVTIISLQVLILVVLLLFWQPWAPALDENTRKITITGTATVKAEPDQYVFSPSYSRDTSDEIAKLNEKIVTKLKSLGVEDGQIKNNANRSGEPEMYMYGQSDGKKEKTTLTLTITVADKKLAQKVQDYLLTTNPRGSVTPYPSFSTEKRNELENSVRDKAIKDAREKADKTAEGLGASIGRVINVDEGGGNGGCGFDCVVGMDSSVSAREQGKSVTPAAPSLGVQPGKDEFSYSVTVVFELR